MVRSAHSEGASSEEEWTNAAEVEWRALCEVVAGAENVEQVQALSADVGTRLLDLPSCVWAPRLSEALRACSRHRLVASDCSALAWALAQWCCSTDKSVSGTQEGGGKDDEEVLNEYVLIGLDNGHGTPLVNPVGNRRHVLNALLSVIESDAPSLLGLYKLFRDEKGLGEYLSDRFLPKLAKCKSITDHDLLDAYQDARYVSSKQKLVAKCFKYPYRKAFLVHLKFALMESSIIDTHPRAKTWLPYAVSADKLRAMARFSADEKEKPKLCYFPMNGNLYLEVLQQDLQQASKDPFLRGDILRSFFQRMQYEKKYYESSGVSSPEARLPVEHAHRLLDIWTDKKLMGLFAGSRKDVLAHLGLGDSSADAVTLDVRKWEYYFDAVDFPTSLLRRCDSNFIATKVINLLSESEYGLCISNRPLLDRVSPWFYCRFSGLARGWPPLLGKKKMPDRSNALRIVRPIFDAVSFEVFWGTILKDMHLNKTSEGRRMPKLKDKRSASPFSLAWQTFCAAKMLFHNALKGKEEKKLLRLSQAWFSMFQRHSEQLLMLFPSQFPKKGSSWLEAAISPFRDRLKVVFQKQSNGERFRRNLLEDILKFARLGVENNVVTALSVKEVLTSSIYAVIWSSEQAETREWVLKVAREWILFGAVPLPSVDFDSVEADSEEDSDTDSDSVNESNLSWDYQYRMRVLERDYRSFQSLPMPDQLKEWSSLEQLVSELEQLLKRAKLPKEQRIHFIESTCAEDGTIRLKSACYKRHDYYVRSCTRLLNAILEMQIAFTSDDKDGLQAVLISTGLSKSSARKISSQIEDYDDLFEMTFDDPEEFIYDDVTKLIYPEAVHDDSYGDSYGDARVATCNIVASYFKGKAEIKKLLESTEKANRMHALFERVYGLLGLPELLAKGKSGDFDKRIDAAVVAKKAHPDFYAQTVRQAFLRGCVELLQDGVYQKYRRKIHSFDSSIDAEIIQHHASARDKAALQNLSDPASQLDAHSVDIRIPSERAKLQEEYGQPTWNQRLECFRRMFKASLAAMYASGRDCEQVCVTLQFIAHRSRNEAAEFRDGLFEILGNDLGKIVQSTFNLAAEGEDETEKALKNAHAVSTELIRLIQNSTQKLDHVEGSSLECGSEIFQRVKDHSFELDGCEEKLLQIWVNAATMVYWIERGRCGEAELRDFAWPFIGRYRSPWGPSRNSFDTTVKPIFVSQLRGEQQYRWWIGFQGIKSAFDPKDVGKAKRRITSSKWIEILLLALEHARSMHWQEKNKKESHAGGKQERPWWLGREMFGWDEESCSMRGLQRLEALLDFAGNSWAKSPILLSTVEAVFNSLDECVAAPENRRSEELFLVARAIFYRIKGYAMCSLWAQHEVLWSALNKLVQVASCDKSRDVVAKHRATLFATLHRGTLARTRIDLSRLASDSPDVFAFLLGDKHFRDAVSPKHFPAHRCNVKSTRKALAKIALGLCQSAVFHSLVKKHLLLYDEERIAQILAMQIKEAAAFQALPLGGNRPASLGGFTCTNEQEAFLETSHFWGAFHPLYPRKEEAARDGSTKRVLKVVDLAPVKSIPRAVLEKRFPPRIALLLFDYHSVVLKDREMPQKQRLRILKNMLRNNPAISEQNYWSLLSDFGSDEAMRDTILNQLFSLDESIFWRILGELVGTALGASRKSSASVDYDKQPVQTAQAMRCVLLLLPNLQRRVPDDKMLSIYKVVLEQQIADKANPLPVTAAKSIIRGLFDIKHDSVERQTLILAYWGTHMGLHVDIVLEFASLSLSVLQEEGVEKARPLLAHTCWTIVKALLRKPDLDEKICYTLFAAWQSKCIQVHPLSMFYTAPASVNSKRLRDPEEFAAIQALEKISSHTGGCTAPIPRRWPELLSTFAETHDKPHVRLVAQLISTALRSPELVFKPLAKNNDEEERKWLAHLLQELQDIENMDKPEWSHRWRGEIVSQFIAKVAMKCLWADFERKKSATKEWKTLNGKEQIKVRERLQENALASTAIAQQLFDFLKPRLDVFLQTPPAKYIHFGATLAIKHTLSMFQAVSDMGPFYIQRLFVTKSARIAFQATHCLAEIFINALGPCQEPVEKDALEELLNVLSPNGIKGRQRLGSKPQSESAAAEEEEFSESAEESSSEEESSGE